MSFWESFLTYHLAFAAGGSKSTNNITTMGEDVWWTVLIIIITGRVVSEDVPFQQAEAACSRIT